MANLSLSRRGFVTSLLAGGTLMIGMPSALLARQSETGESAITPLVSFDANGETVFYCPSPDMGQGVDTSLAMLFAEEAELNFDTLRVKPLPYGLKRNEEGQITWKVVGQFAGGSTSIPRLYKTLRDIGAGTRQLFLQAAAKQFGVPVAALNASNGAVEAPGGRSASYHALAAAAASEALPDGYEPALKSRSDWKLVGKAKMHKAAEDIVRGKPLYGMDMDYPGAKVAVVARSPYFDGEVSSFDDSKTRALKGVIDVVHLPRPDMDKNYTYLAAGLAVIAEDFWTAKKGRDLLEIVWDKGPYAAESSEGLYAQCDDLLTKDGQIVRADGNYAEAVRAAESVVERTYKLPQVSHAQLEPQNCIAHVQANTATVIGPFQGPGGASRHVATFTGLDRVGLDVRYTRLGGGFGRRLTSDHAAEAILISKLSGLPVKLIWTREDDLSNDFYRPMGHHKMVAGFDAAGKLTAWSQHLAGRPKYYRRDNVKREDYFGADLYVDDFPAGLVDNLQLEYSIAESGSPQGSWRAPAHTANAFVIQSFLDEIAHERGEDPLALRLRLLGDAKEFPYSNHGSDVFDTGRLSGVLTKAAEMAGWGRALPKGRALGIAGHFTFGGYCAHVADVELRADGGFIVHKVWSAIDIGVVINPQGVIAQMEGGINDGLSAAMGQEIIVEAGQVVTDNFDSYPMLRMADSVRDIEVHIMESDKEPVGMGEMSLPPLPPAVSNALFRAGGPRLRSNPFSKGV